MSRYRRPREPFSVVDALGYATTSGARVHRRPQSYRDPDFDAAGQPPYSDGLLAAARAMLDRDPLLRRVYSDGAAFAAIAAEAACHRSTVLRRHAAFLTSEARPRLLAHHAYEVSVRDGGGTFDLRTCCSIVDDVWAVGLKRYGAQVKDLSSTAIEAYLRRGPDDLPLGTFREGCHWCLDRVLLVRDRSAAERVGIDEDQDSIYHLGRRLCHRLARRRAA